MADSETESNEYKRGTCRYDYESHYESNTSQDERVAVHCRFLSMQRRLTTASEHTSSTVPAVTLQIVVLVTSYALHGAISLS